MNETEQKVRYHVIPNDIFKMYEERKINGEEVMLLMKINSFKDCYASNEWLGDWWGKSAHWVSETLSRLEKAEIITITQGRKRHVKTCFDGEFSPCKKNHTLREKPQEGVRKTTGQLSNTKLVNNTSGATARSGVINGFVLNGELNGHSKADKLVNRFVDFTISNSLHLGRKGSTRHGWQKHVLDDWKRSVEDLLAQTSPVEVKEVLRWYFDHFRDQFVPKCYTLKSFCQRFVEVKEAMRRPGENTNHRNGERRAVVNGRPLTDEEMGWV